MEVKVVDASALAAVIFGEPETEQIAARLTGAALVAPALLSFEIVNACATKLRRHPDRRSAILQAFVLQGGLSVEPAEIDRSAVLFLAEETGLTGYDASYLWLARHPTAELVTLDRKLERAAARIAPIR